MAWVLLLMSVCRLDRHFLEILVPVPVAQARGARSVIGGFLAGARWGSAVRAVDAFDGGRPGRVGPLLRATQNCAARGAGSTGARLQPSNSRVLRDALYAVLAPLQFGQVVLATVVPPAPFVGLLGTVWGILPCLGRPHPADHHRPPGRAGGRSRWS